MAYIGSTPVPSGIKETQSFTATAGQTTFNTLGYSNGNNISVFLNGVRLINGTDYTATNGSDIVLTAAASASDVLEFETFNEFNLVNQNLTTPTFKNSMTMKNDTEEDTDGGRESTVIFQGEQSGGEISTLAEIEASHDGTADDQKGDLIFRTNDGSDNAAPTEALRIDSSQNIGIGGSPKPYLSAYKALDINTGRSSIMSSTGTPQTWMMTNSYYDSTNSRNEYSVSSHAASYYLQQTGAHFFATAPSGTADAAITFTEKVRIDSDGLKFNGDTAAANALDDYEEGTWTPQITFGGGSTGMSFTSSGSYTKIGRLVYINGVIGFSNKGSSTGTVRFTNLPFNVADVLTGTGNGGSLNIHFFSDSTTSHLYSFFSEGNSYSQGLNTQVNHANELNNTDFTNSTNLRLNGVYVTT